jgi:hypothetical protein
MIQAQGIGTGLSTGIFEGDNLEDTSNSSPCL